MWTFVFGSQLGGGGGLQAGVANLAQTFVMIKAGAKVAWF